MTLRLQTDYKHTVETRKTSGQKTYVLSITNTQDPTQSGEVTTTTDPQIANAWLLDGPQQ